MTDRSALSKTHTALRREQRAAYFAWQNEPSGATAARDHYIEASEHLRVFNEHTVPAEIGAGSSGR